MTRRNPKDRDDGRDLAVQAKEVGRMLQARYRDTPGHDIDDAVAEAVAQWIERYATVYGSGPTNRMLYRLAEWRLLDRLGAPGRQVRDPATAPEAAADSQMNPDRRVLHREALSWTRSMRRLTTRSVSILAMWSRGFSLDEISSRLGMRAFTVRKKKERALKKIRKALEN